MPDPEIPSPAETPLDPSPPMEAPPGGPLEFPPEAPGPDEGGDGRPIDYS